LRLTSVRSAWTHLKPVYIQRSTLVSKQARQQSRKATPEAQDRVAALLAGNVELRAVGEITLERLLPGELPAIEHRVDARLRRPSLLFSGSF